MAEERVSAIRRCEHCELPYDWRRSGSWSLKLTFCTSLCEKAANTYTIEELLSARPEHWAWEVIELADLIPAEAAPA